MMRDNNRNDYWRTIAKLNFLKVDINFLANEFNLFHLLASNLEFQDFIDNQPHLDSNSKKLLKEVYYIEKEKENLKNTPLEIRKIFDKESEIFKERELFLSQDIDNQYEVRFVVNPLLRIYRTTTDCIFDKASDLSHIMEKRAQSTNENYFLAFLQTGSYDVISGSNILESSIDEYEYFLLTYMEEPMTIFSAIKIFENEFDIKSESEQQQIRKLTRIIIRKLIYKTFIIKHNNSKYFRTL